MPEVTICPICSSSLQEIARVPDHDAYEIRCPRCGRYSLTGTMLAVLSGHGDPKLEALRPYLSAHTRQSNRAGTTVRLTTTNWRASAEAHSKSTMNQKLRKLLEYVGDGSDSGGAKVWLAWDQDYPLFDATGVDELAWLANALHAQDLIDHNFIESYASLTADGWEAYRPSGSGSIQGTCFVAMAFHGDLDDCYAKGIRPAVEEDCGFSVIRLDKVEHNENINDKILGDIRACQLLVADFTLHRNGVYFEAGFALGLGKPVVWLCRRTDFDTAHFDTRPYNHILWDTPEQLRERLTDRIRATIANASKV